MAKSLSSKMAEDIVNVLKYNPDLPHEDKVLAVESRLIVLAQDIETAAAQAQKHSQENAVIVDDRPQDITVLQLAMIKQQQMRGPAN